ncbi:MAG: exodeoxyribonuclease III [bacterium]|nr:exodeoxyribonuclease III [bacterium]
MRVATWNVNGIRAALRKGFEDHVRRVKPEVLLLQEVRALPEQIPENMRCPEGWSTLWHPAEKKGYSGTAVWACGDGLKEESRGIGSDDHEGRVVVARAGKLRVVSVYLPSGSSGDHRQAIKDEWLPAFMDWARPMLRSRIPTVLGGDFNIAHTERDIFYAKSNQNTSGFLPHERAWMGEMIEFGWRDIIREKYGEVDGPYSWWSNRGQARVKDRGWRIDYLLLNKAAHKVLKDCHIDRQSGLEVSDHAMVVADLDL